MMNRPMFKRLIPQALAWAGLVALCGALALAQGTAAPPSPAAAVRTDGQIEMDVVHALDASTVLKNDLITAATIQGEVTLSGTVASASSRDLAESIVSHVQGVVKVNNNLRVGNPQDASTAQNSVNSQPGDAGIPSPAALPSAPAMTDGPLPPPGQPAPAQSDAQAQLRAEIRAEVIAEIQAQRRAQQQAQQRQDPYSESQYPPPPPPSSIQESPKGPVTIPQGALLQLRTSESVGSKHAKEGEPVQFVVIHDVNVGGVLAIPRGATVHGVVTEVKKPGDLGGSAALALKLTSLDLGGQNYPIDSGLFKVKGPNKAGQTVGSAIGGGILGTMIGCAVGRGAGCAIGAGTGVAAGTAASAASPGPNVWIPAEALVEFHLNSPLTVTPVTAQEAARLAQGLYSGGPTLHQRGYGAYYARPYPYAYGYPEVYYHPYYVVGGYYYWR
ncbi:MAG: BON domain-containing protein [Terracidiphilus sp.]